MTAEVEISGDPTALYRLYSATGTLLYVGVTRSIPLRFAKHRALKSWWPEVSRKTMVWYGSREEAEHAERVTVRAERPVYNVMLRKPPYVKKQESRGRPSIGGKTVLCLGPILPAVDALAAEDGISRAKWVRRAVEAELARREAGTLSPAR